jgi:hypothetical protein
MVVAGARDPAVEAGVRHGGEETGTCGVRAERGF